MHPNEELIRTAYEAFGKGDIEHVTRILHEDMTWHEAGHNPLSGDYNGRAAVLDYLARLAALTQGSFREEVHAVLADDRHAVVMTHHAWDAPHPYAGPGVQIYHVRDGMVTECWALNPDQDRVDASLG